jgi:glycosyltransferase involved in cell wall biosynthesis
MKVLLAWRGACDAQDLAIYSRRQLPLLLALRDAGVDLAVALFGDDGGLHRRLADCGIAAEVLPLLPPPAATAGAFPGAVWRLRQMIRRHRPDLVEGSDPLPGLAATLACIGLAPRPLTVYRRHFDGGRLRARLPSRVAALLADRMIASCEGMRRIVIEKERKAPQQVDVATSGIEEPEVHSPESLAQTRASLGVPPDAVLLGVVAYLRPQKGVDVLLRALPLLQARPSVQLVVVGHGPQLPLLRALAEQAAVPVHFLGHRIDAPRWIAASDAMVMPSREEAFGRVTLEVMAAGRPLVASAVGGLPDAVVHGETGLLVPRDDPAALAGALRALVDDACLRQRMGRAARTRYEQGFTISHMASSWCAAWQRALAAQHPTLALSP